MTYPRRTLQGIYIPREDITGYCIDIGAQSFTHLIHGPVSEIEGELDSIGCLTQASVKLKRPRLRDFPAYALGVTIWLDTRTYGRVEVCRGYIAAATQDDLNAYTLPVRPLEDLSMKDYYDGSLAHASGELAEVSSYLQKNEEVVTAALKDRPKASIGVDHQGEVRLAEPSEGEPVRVSRSLFYNWKSTGLIVLPYATRSRWDGGPGWLKGEYTGIARPPYAERRAVDAGEATFTELTRPYGPPLVTVAELVVNSRPDPVAVDAKTGLEVAQNQGEVSEALPKAIDPVPGAVPAATLTKETMTAQQYALIAVYDLQAWYEGSSIPGQGVSDLVKQLQDTLKAAQEAFALSVAATGEGSGFSLKELEKLQAAKNRVRLANLGQNAQVSDYEPLTARLSSGFVLDHLFWGDFVEDPTQAD